MIQMATDNQKKYLAHHLRDTAMGNEVNLENIQYMEALEVICNMESVGGKRMREVKQSFVKKHTRHVLEDKTKHLLEGYE
jgi:hypothetical protein